MSNIDFTTIDENYPIAGQDNDSQGFRDNFNSIKNNLALAKTEIGALEDNTAKLNTTNDFLGNIIQNANMLSNTTRVYSLDNVASTIDINWNNGEYQTIQVASNITLRLTGWPTSTPSDRKLAYLRLVLTGITNPNAVENTNEITFTGISGAILRLESNSLNPIQVTYTNIAKIYEFWTSDGGATIYGHYIGEFAA